LYFTKIPPCRKRVVSVSLLYKKGFIPFVF
jgi:hypothetical protein